MNQDILLTNLNQSQRAAVSSSADTLAILAGPGSGKTHTLTSRTAWLLAQGLQPWNVIVATFTIKAAREMKERIGKLLGNGTEGKLILGTFHSICRRYLARYGHLINIPKGFGIADSNDSLAICKRIKKRHAFELDASAARSRISSRKARGEAAVENRSKSGAKTVEAQEFERYYLEYEEALKRSNLLDYDDLLLRCVDLLRQHPSCVSNVEAVLIDEFQDTNVVQFDLMRLFAAHRNRITIVGDPDQSIYGFRAAEVKNYKRMLRQYPDTVTIALEENYRSSGSILLSALQVIEQDSSRVVKSLLATHIVGTQPVLRTLFNAHKEAEWIVSEIRRVKGMSGDLLDLNDFAILLRSSRLSLLIETALGKAGISYRMVGGLKFYDRVEIKTMLDYLRVINQPDNNDALSRILNVPRRGVGDTTIKALLEEADKTKVTLWSLILGTSQGNRSVKTKISKGNGNGITKLVNIILTARTRLSPTSKERLTISELIRFIMTKTNYERWLEEAQGDTEKAKFDNVEELITQATDFQNMVSDAAEDEALPLIDGLAQGEDVDPLSRFLANVALANEVKDAEGSSTAQVTISTIHSAKGLEWPIVFIPGAYEGSIPHSRAEDTNEELRLLYVAMTRAKALLYLSRPMKMSGHEGTTETTASPFLTHKNIKSILNDRGPSLGPSVVQSISQILRRACPSRSSIAKSSASIDRAEDDFFSTRGEEDEHEHEHEKEWRWNAGNGHSFTQGQQAPKRQRVELARSISNLETVSGKNWKPTYATTMDHASSFTFSSIGTGFVSAGTHLQVLREHSMHSAGSLTTSRKMTGKQRAKVVEGQATLLEFLGKQEPATPILTAPRRKECGQSGREVSSRFAASDDFHQPRVTLANDRSQCIEPALASHRLNPRNMRSKPPKLMPDEQPSTHYPYFSSSPPRAKHSSPPVEPEQPQASSSRPLAMSLIRPPLSKYTTTMDRLQDGGTGKKTLGMSRNMKPWSSKAGQGFRPPTMQRPNR